MNPAAPRPLTASVWAMLFMLSLLWGGSFLFNAVAVREVPVFSVVAARVALAALALHVAMRASGIAFPVHREAVTAFFGMAVLNNLLPFNLIVFGQGRIDSGLASILNATTPIFTMLIAHVATRDEKLGLAKGIGVALGFLGVVVLFSGRDLFGAGTQGQLLGQGACLAAALAYGFAGIYGRRFARLGIAPIAVAAGQVTMSSLVMVPLALIVDRPFAGPMPSLPALASLVALALASSAAAYILFFRILARAGATAVSLVTLLIPCWAIALGALVLGERLELRAVIGFLIIAAGLLIIDGRVLAQFRKEG